MPFRVALIALLLLADRQDDLKLENASIRARFRDGRLVRIENVKSGEALDVDSRDFEIDTPRGRISDRDARRLNTQSAGGTVLTRYASENFDIEVRTALAARYLRKQISIKAKEPSGVKTVTMLEVKTGLSGRVHKSYHCQYYFGASDKGGLVAGIECPFAPISIDEGRFVASYAPGMKVGAGEIFESEPAFLGVYACGDRPREEAEREAMTEVISLELGPPRRAFWQAYNGWSAGTFRRDLSHRDWPKHKAFDLESIRLSAEAGLDFWTPAATWGGDYQSVEKPDFQGSAERRGLLDELKKNNVGLLHWFSVNNLNPWMGEGRYRRDKPEWAIYRQADKPDPKSNCCGCPEFMRWLTAAALADLRRTQAAAFCTDGDLAGGPGSVGGNIGYPVVCHAQDHAHLSTDATYAAWKGIMELYRRVRQEFPNLTMYACRPHQDLGAWSWRYLDGIFTVDEFPKAKKVPGCLSLGVGMGEDVRKRATHRRHRDFCPYWLDSAILYPIHYVNNPGFEVWDRSGHEYALISTIAVCDSANSVSLPARDRSVPADMAALKKWADWARRNAQELGPVIEWPAPGVEGTARLKDGRGFLFLFNPSTRAQPVAIPFDGILTEVHPIEGRRYLSRSTVRIPPQSAMVLRIQPDDLKPAVFGAVGQVEPDGETLALTGVRGPEGEVVDVQVRAPEIDRVCRVRVNGTALEFRKKDGLVHISIPFGGIALVPELSAWKTDGAILETTFALPERAKEILASRRCAERSAADSEKFCWGDESRLLLSIPIEGFDRHGELPVVWLNGREVPVRVTPKDIAAVPYADLTDAAVPGAVNVLRVSMKEVRADVLAGALLVNVRPRMTEAIGRSEPPARAPQAQEEY